MGTSPGNGRKKKWWLTTTFVALVSLLAVSAGANDQSFTDVPTDHLFHGDIEWMKEHDITRGCNPPANTKYCAEDNTTRGEMAAFFHRFARSRAVDAGTLEGYGADSFLLKDEAGNLEGLRGEPGPVGPQGEPGLVSGENVTIVTAEEGDGSLVVGAGNTYTVFCPAGQVAISGGYSTDFVLVSERVDNLVDGIGSGILSGLGLGDLLDLGTALDGVANVNVHTDGPVYDDVDDLWGWQIGTTIDLASDISVTAMCVG